MKKYNLDDKFVYLGLIPYAHIIPLMRLSAGVINPSFFEGWSTTVEEAKAVGAPLLLSDLSIHREQAGEKAIFFDPENIENITEALVDGWQLLSSGPRHEVEQLGVFENNSRRKEFALNFGKLVAHTLNASGS